MQHYTAILLSILLNSSPCVIQENPIIQSNIMSSDSTETIAKNLTEAGYSGLFLSGDRSLSNSIWHNGENRIYLEQIVQSDRYSDLARILASEVLYEKVPNYPPQEWEETLAYVYSQALALTGVETGGLQITGNLWGFMYYTDKEGIKDYGILGTHLINTGRKVIPYLTKLLDNSDTIFYEGSHEATLGNSFRYRVKDAAAFYLGKITGIPVKFYEKEQDRDAEIERLKEALKNNY